MKEKENSPFSTQTLFLAIIIVVIISLLFVYYWQDKNHRRKIEDQEKATITAFQSQSAQLKTASQLTSERYLIAREIVENRTDILFDKTLPSEPTIKLKTVPENLRTKINQERRTIAEILRNWENLIYQSNFGSNSNLTEQEIKNLMVINLYLANLQSALNSLPTNNSELSKKELDYYQSIVADAKTEIETKIITPSTENNQDLNRPATTSSDGRPKLIEGINVN